MASDIGGARWEPDYRAELAALRGEFEALRGSALNLFIARAIRSRDAVDDFRRSGGPNSDDSGLGLVLTGAQFDGESGPIGLECVPQRAAPVWQTRGAVRSSEPEGSPTFLRAALYGDKPAWDRFRVLTGRAFDAYLGLRGETGQTAYDMGDDERVLGWLYRVLAAPEMADPPACRSIVQRLAWGLGDEWLDRKLEVWRGLFATDVFTLSARAIAMETAEAQTAPETTANTDAATGADLLDETREGAQRAKESEAWGKLTEAQRNYLIAALELGAVDKEHCATTEEIAKTAGYKSANANGRHAFRELKQLGYIDSKEGRGGGMWLTDLGRQVAESGNCGS